MINLTSPRLLMKDPSGRRKPSSTDIILTEFIFPGPLNRVASQMTGTPSSLQQLDDNLLSKLPPNRNGTFEELESIKMSRHYEDSFGFASKCVSVALEYLGMLSPEQLKFGK